MTNTMKVKALLQLTKFRITIVVTLTTIAGYGLASGGFDLSMLLPAFGLFFVAAGSAALNQFQERKFDAMMERTKSRPLPSGIVEPRQALAFAWFLILLGTGVILITSNLAAAFFALLAVLWYNGIYTPLKRKSAFAVIPGSVIGALPPAVGWAAGGGDIFSPGLYLLMFFFFIWQIPHFWLLLMRFGRDYEKAGFPVLTNIYSEEQLRRITFLWALATAVSALFIPYFHITTSILATFITPLISIVFIFIFVDLIRMKKEFRLKKYFMAINFYLLAVLIVMYLDVIL